MFVRNICTYKLSLKKNWNVQTDQQNLIGFKLRGLISLKICKIWWEIRILPAGALAMLDSSVKWKQTLTVPGKCSKTTFFPYWEVGLFYRSALLYVNVLNPTPFFLTKPSVFLIAAFLAKLHKGFAVKYKSFSSPPGFRFPYELKTQPRFVQKFNKGSWTFLAKLDWFMILCHNYTNHVASAHSKTRWARAPSQANQSSGRSPSTLSCSHKGRMLTVHPQWLSGLPSNKRIDP